VFDQYVKTRAEEERREKKNKIMQAKEDFKKMMEEAKFNPRYVVSYCHISKYVCVFSYDQCVCRCVDIFWIFGLEKLLPYLIIDWLQLF
jgi:hypothetical protein